MPKLLHRKPKYRKHASGQAVITLGGRDVYLGKHGTAASKREYERLSAEYRANNRTLPARVVGTDYAIAELVNAYWKHCQEYHAAAANKGELGSIKLALRVVNRLYADVEVVDYGPLALLATRDAMVAEGWSRNYVNVQVTRLRRMFKWGVARELVPANVWHALRAVDPLLKDKSKAREKAPVGSVEDRVIDAVLPWLGRHVAGMVQIQRLTACRPGEACAMRWDEIDTTNADLWEHRPRHHKTAHKKHERIILINREAQAVLSAFGKPGDAGFVFSPIEAEAERRASLTAARKTPLSCGNKPGSNRQRKPRRAPGQRYTVESYRRAIARACDLANAWAKGGMIIANDERAVPRFHPHQIRHLAGTLIRAAHGAEVAQTVLGHRHLKASEIYAERPLARAKEAMMKGV